MLMQTSLLIGFETVVLETNENMISEAQAITIFGALFLLGGLLVMFSQGRQPFGRARQYLGTGAFDPGEMGGAGSIAVRGTIAEFDGTIRGPLSGEECVVYEDESQVYRRDWKYDRDERREMRHRELRDEEEIERKITTWETTSYDSGGVPFVIDSKHGPVLVDPDGAKLDLPIRAVEQTSLFRRLLHRFPFVAYLGKYTSSVGNPKRRREYHITTGDQVLVMGTAEETDGDAIAKIENGGGLFMLSTRSKWNLAIRNFVKAFTSSFFGIIFFLIGVAIFVAAARFGMLW